MGSYDVAFAQSDEGSHREVLERIHAAWFSGDRPPAQPRPVIRDSWLRVRRAGMNPAKIPATVESEPDAGDAAILTLLPVIESILGPLVDDSRVLLVLSDAQGTIRWRSGERAIMKRADEFSFQPGNRWSEKAVGTNAIGTALSAGIPVHVHAAEHFCVSHHAWSCAAAPVIDPRTMRPLGAIDLSFPVEDANPMAIALVASVARQIGVELKAEHGRSLDRLTASTRTPVSGRWALVDDWGWVAAAGEMPTKGKLRLPGNPQGVFTVDRLGLVTGDRVAGGWLLRPAGTWASVQERLELTLSEHRCRFTVQGSTAGATHELQGRRAQIVAWLADHPAGVSARELAEAVYGRPDATAAVRAEICRINGELGTVVHSRPYRLDDQIKVIDGR
ncbi:GAF domain-containing protein [Propionimicrobium sp. PCR01-08-3]|uniref:GAF domain-containing protein n=1 Tax=Propionimicrobium sp. PCR01-08-3 TaxID=3052086 RepID=UPI00255C7FFC|nr:GAF domain-containing protein [Propionimicrobium sp. PCR01-08-3]WIY82302.1 GAF domain-containing protein [Propionimicrobium sp. PCR01-08-3]